MLPRIANVGKDRRQRHNLRLVRQIENPVDMQHVEEFGGLDESALHLRFVLLVGIQRQIEQAKIEITVSRLARGIPVGVDLEYADQITLTHALEGRRVL